MKLVISSNLAFCTNLAPRDIMLIVAWKISSCTELILMDNFCSRPSMDMLLLASSFFHRPFSHRHFTPDVKPSFTGIVLPLTSCLLSLDSLSQACYCWLQAFFLWSCSHRHVIADVNPSFSGLVITDMLLLTSSLLSLDLFPQTYDCWPLYLL